MKNDIMSVGSFPAVLSRLVGLAASLAIAVPALAGDVPFTEHVISINANGPLSVFATDVDGDGDIDILSASWVDDKIAWYESDGGSPPTFTEHVISTTADVPVSVFATDVDGDGDTDVLSASVGDNTSAWYESNGKVVWYENDGGSPPTFTEHVISTTADTPVSVFATDVDGDGDTDVLSASLFDDKIAWYENDGGSPPSFTERVVSTNADGAESVFATDLDDDGDTDVLSASQVDDKIAWYENDGGSPPSFTERVISTNAVGVQFVFATDLDNDGDTDVLSATAGDNKIRWYENDGGSPPSFSEHVISTSIWSFFSVFAADVDNDGDTDVLSASPKAHTVAWYENDGGSPPSFTERAVSTDATGAWSVFAADVDNDGDTDVLSGLTFLVDKIMWYENTTPLCHNGFINQGEECDGGLACTSCLCDADFEPTDPPSLDCQPICGNSSVDPGEACDGVDDLACPGACLSDCTCGPFCGDGVCDPGESSCNCPDDCGTPPQNETPDATCDDGVDNDCDSLIDADDPDCDIEVPTVSTWGLIVIALLLLAGAKVRFGSSRTAITQ